MTTSSDCEDADKRPQDPLPETTNNGNDVTHEPAVITSSVPEPAVITSSVPDHVLDRIRPLQNYATLPDGPITAELLTNFGNTPSATNHGRMTRAASLPSSPRSTERGNYGYSDVNSGVDCGMSSDRSSTSSVVDCLLFEIYDRCHYYPRRGSYDSDTTSCFTEYSSMSDAVFSRSDLSQYAFIEEESHGTRLTRKYLKGQDLVELKELRAELQHRVTQNSARLIRQLKNRDRRLAKQQRHCDILTAVLQASSPKRRIDSKIRFSIAPLPGEDAFNQWRDAMKAVARLPLGVPCEFRKKVWLSLADNHMTNLKVDWDTTRKLAFNERSNPDDNKLGLQIVKDLHRTGCSGFSGTDNEEERAVLKRVLLAYARWNKKVGYCQGFNVLAALILDVMENKEDDALKVMIYLVDRVLPESYFANNLRALSVDMAVFRDLLHVQHPQLARRLDQLQAAARDDTTGASYEPPLTNVFTMQWFLTLFATCLPKPTALRVWDSVLLEGSEILLRTAVALWGKLQTRIMNVQSADEFYTIMGTLTNEMLNCNCIEPDDLMKTVYAMGPLPFPQLSELREKYTYNITPFTAAMTTGPRNTSDDDDFDEDEFVENINCFTGIFPPQTSPSRKLADADRSQSSSSFDISKVSPGAYAAQPEIIGPVASMYAERMSLDIDQLKKQYKRLRVRQDQAHIILAAASARHNASKNVTPTKVMQKTKRQQPAVAPIQSPVAVNHLFMGRHLLVNGKRNKAVTQAPHIAPFYPNNTKPYSQMSASVAEHVKEFRRSKSSLTQDPSEVLASLPNSERKRGVNRSVSVDSSESGHSTLRSSHRSDSLSDMSTHLESELESDNESVVFQNGPKADLMTFAAENVSKDDLESDSDAAISSDSPDSCSVQSSAVVDSNLQDDSQATKQNSEDNTDNSDAYISAPESPMPAKMESSSSSSEEIEKPDNPKQVNSQEGNDTESKPADAEIRTSPLPKETLQKESSTKRELSKPAKLEIPSSSLATEPTPVQPLPTSVDTYQVSSLTYKRDVKPKAALNGLASSSPSISNQEEATSPSSPSQKVFNPFPGQHRNSRKYENGVKLGLYPAGNAPTLDLSIGKPDRVRSISRAHINACLHRQYMAEIKQQAKSARR